MKYWIYTFDDDTYGIVKADTEEEAKQKVLKAYFFAIVLMFTC